MQNSPGLRWQLLPPWLGCGLAPAGFWQCPNLPEKGAGRAQLFPPSHPAQAEPQQQQRLSLDRFPPSLSRDTIPTGSVPCWRSGGCSRSGHTAPARGSHLRPGQGTTGRFPEATSEASRAAALGGQPRGTPPPEPRGMGGEGSVPPKRPSPFPPGQREVGRPAPAVAGSGGGVSCGAREPARRMSPSHSSSSACPFAAQPAAGKGRRRAAWGAAGCASPPCSPWAPAPAWRTRVGKGRKGAAGAGDPPAAGQPLEARRGAGSGERGGDGAASSRRAGGPCPPAAASRPGAVGRERRDAPGSTEGHPGGEPRVRGDPLQLAACQRRFVSPSALSFPWRVPGGPSAPMKPHPLLRAVGC